MLPAGDLDHAERLLGDCYNDEIFELIVAGFQVLADQTVAPHLVFEDHLKITRAA